MRLMGWVSATAPWPLVTVGVTRIWRTQLLSTSQRQVSTEQMSTQTCPPCGCSQQLPRSSGSWLPLMRLVISTSDVLGALLPENYTITFWEKPQAWTSSS